MENDLNKDEFELFLKQKADQHKLYPSDKVWKGIYSSLHPGMKWFKIGGSLLILSTLFFIFQQTSLLDPSNFLSNKRMLHKTAALPSGAAGQTGKSQPAVANDNSVNSRKINNTITVPTGAAATALNNIDGQSGVPFNLVADNNSFKANDQLKGFVLRNDLEIKHSLPVMVSIPFNHVTTAPSNIQGDKQPDISDGKDLKTAVVNTSALSSQQEISAKEINWLQEMAAIKLTTHNKNRFNIQFYFSPTISYRRLADNQNSSHTGLFSAPVSTRDLNINNYVNQSPAIGAELGSNVLFSASRHLTFKTGLQLNYSRYNVKAFRYYYEKASIALSSGGSVPDTISSYTSVRNFNGYSPEQLQNQYLQLSVPIGAELRVAGNKRLQLSVAATIQPTFLLFSNTYLLSTNYLNYTKEPSLVRKWNAHSGFEAFLSYKTGGFRWQVGPQFRYQLMSSFNDRYPIKEYLFEYGIKIGVSKTLR